MKFFFDNNISPDLVRGLRELRRNYSETIVHLRERYGDDPVEDVRFLSELADEGGWSVISGDRFKKNPAERQAVRDPNLNVFVLAKGFNKLPSWERTKFIVNKWEDIAQLSGLTAGGVFEVRKRGRILPYQV